MIKILLISLLNILPLLNVGDEFQATDSFTIVSTAPVMTDDTWTIDSITVYEGTTLFIVEKDSLAVKIVNENYRQGWVTEEVLRDKILPNHVISHLFHDFSDNRVLCFITALCIGAVLIVIRLLRKQYVHFVHFNDVHSVYPMLLCLTVAVSAIIYSHVQSDYVDVWREFYFNPELNPLRLPLPTAMFVSSLWLILILFIAAIDDLRHSPNWDDNLAYLMSLIVVCLFVYFIFNFISHFGFLEYILFPIYAFFAIYMHIRNGRTRYVCGNCGRPMTAKGKCKICGAKNV